MPVVAEGGLRGEYEVVELTAAPIGFKRFALHRCFTCQTFATYTIVTLANPNVLFPEDTEDSDLIWTLATKHHICRGCEEAFLTFCEATPYLSMQEWLEAGFELTMVKR